MRRALFNFLAIVATVVFLLSVAGWVQSVWKGYGCEWGPAGSVRLIWSQNGALGFGVENSLDFESPLAFQFATIPKKWVVWPDLDLYGVVTGPRRKLPGLVWEDIHWEHRGGAQQPPIDRWKLLVSYWLIALLSTPLPALWAWRHYKSQRFAAGLCQKCGYDLRASPERCPECGAAISK
jgi:hypothetical protein